MYCLENFSRRHCELQENHKLWNDLRLGPLRDGALFHINWTYNSGFNKFLFKPFGNPYIASGNGTDKNIPGIWESYLGNGDIEYYENFLDKNGKRYEIHTDYFKKSDTTDRCIYINGRLNSINGMG